MLFEVLIEFSLAFFMMKKLLKQNFYWRISRFQSQVQLFGCLCWIDPINERIGVMSFSLRIESRESRFPFVPLPSICHVVFTLLFDNPRAKVVCRRQCWGVFCAYNNVYMRLALVRNDVLSHFSSTHRLLLIHYFL